MSTRIEDFEFKPLTNATIRLLAPCDVKPEDRISLALDLDSQKFVAKIFAVSILGDDQRCHASYNARARFPARIPERRELLSNSIGYADSDTISRRYLFGATDVTVLIIRANFAANQILFEDEGARIMFAYLIGTHINLEKNVEMIANFRNKLEVDCSDLVVSEKLPLNRYQQVAAICARRSEGYALFMEQGTGKTPVVVAEICNDAEKLRASGETRMHRTLIVAPKNVRANWIDEIERFKTCNGKAQVLRGGQVERIRGLLDAMVADNAEEFSVVIVSYESMARMVEALKIIEWDLIVLDESHYVKSPEAKRSKAAINLRDAGKKRIILTGTPVCNTPLDVYSQLEFLGRGWSGFTSWKAFKNFYGVWDKTQYGASLVGLQNLPIMKERLARMAFIVSKAEALPDLPDRVFDICEVTMSQEQADIYNEVRKNLLFEIERDLDKATSVTKAMVVTNALTKLLRLAQITSGILAWGAVCDEVTGEIISPKEIEFLSPNPKLEALVEILKDKQPNDKTIVWSCFVPAIKQISARLEAEGIEHVTFFGQTSDDDRAEAVRRFNCDDTCKVFVGNPGAGGTGLNLVGYDYKSDSPGETNCNHCIYYAQDWSYPKRAQSQDRCHRRGTREPVRVTDLVVPASIDEEIRCRVLGKAMTAFEISDVRAILKAVLRGVISTDD